MKKIVFIWLLVTISGIVNHAKANLFPDQKRPVFLVHGTLNYAKYGQMDQETLNKALQELIPQEYRGYMLFSIANSVAENYQKPNGTMESYLDFVKRVDLAGVPFLFEISDPTTGSPNAPYPNDYQTADPKKRYYFTPEQIEEVFKSCSNCQGIETAEVFWSYSAQVKEWLNGTLRVCKKYNKKALIADANFAVTVWSRYFYDCYSELVGEGLGKYLIPLYKNTKPYAAPQSQGALMGGWLTGMVDDYGIWNDNFQWCYYSFRHADELVNYNPDHSDTAYHPFFMYMRQYVLYVALGGRYQKIERPMFSMENGFDALWKHYMYPLLKGLYDHRMVLTREEVAAKCKVMVDPFGSYPYNGTTYAYDPVNCQPFFQEVVPANAKAFDPFGRLYNITWAFSQDPGYLSRQVCVIYVGRDVPDYMIRDALPNESKYYQLPILPHPQASVSSSLQLQLLKLNQFSSQQNLKEGLDLLFTEPSTEGKAWVQDVANSIFVLNTWENYDRNQRIELDLKGAKIRALNGSLPFMNLLVGKRESEGDVETYWFQSHGYNVSSNEIYRAKAHPTLLEFKCDQKPELIVESGNSSSVLSQWNEQTKTFAIEIHHTQGAVSFYLSTDKLSVNPLPDPNEWFMKAKLDSIGYGDRVDNPIEIASPEELALVSHYVGLGRLKNRYFKQVKDLDMTGINWRPIGNMTNNAPFRGFYDGSGYQIKNLQIKPAQPYAGLFGYIQNSELKNIHIVGGNIRGTTCVGGVVGSASGDCVISGCYNSAVIDADDVCVGGIVGEQTALEFLPLNQRVGTISISNCLNVAPVNGFRAVAGIIGSIKNGSIRECANQGSVTLIKTSYCGGGVANVFNPSSGSEEYVIDVTNCYNSGAIGYTGGTYGNYYGIIGTHRNGATPNLTTVNVHNCYNSGLIKGASYNGSLVGENTTNGNCKFYVTSSYSLTGSSSVIQGESMTSTAMQSTSFVDRLNGTLNPKLWAADVNGLLNTGYPVLLNLPSIVDDLIVKDGEFNLPLKDAGSPEMSNMGWSAMSTYQTMGSTSIVEENGNRFVRKVITAANSRDYHMNVSQYSRIGVLPGKYRLKMKARGSAGKAIELKLSTVSDVANSGVTNLENLSSTSSTSLASANLIRFTMQEEWQQYDCKFDLKTATLGELIRIYFYFSELGAFDLDDVVIEPCVETPVVEVPAQPTGVVESWVGAITIHGYESMQAVISSVNGQLICQKTLMPRDRIPLSKGLYILVISHQGQVVRKQRVVVK